MAYIKERVGTSKVLVGGLVHSARPIVLLLADLAVVESQEIAIWSNRHQG